MKLDDAFTTETAGLDDASTPGVIRLRNGDRCHLHIVPVRKRLGDAEVRMLGYNGSIPGPTLHVDQRSKVVVDVTNDGDIETTVHWHGLRLENRYDGVPHDTQAPISMGGGFTYQIDAPDPGIYWYHPHLREDFAQEMGLYGPIVVEPAEVTYLDPQVTPETRTLKARIEVANPARHLTPGMLVDVELSAAGRSSSMVMPKSAAQQVGERIVVFTPDPARNGVFLPKEIHVGAISGDDVQVWDGVAPGDLVVTDGAFALKAEWERIGGRLPASSVRVMPPIPPVMSEGERPQRISLAVTESGFVPASLRVIAGRPIELVVTRTTDKTCGTEIVIGDGAERAALPLNTPVTLRIPAMAKGELQISCGMAMLKGTVIAR